MAARAPQRRWQDGPAPAAPMRERRDGFTPAKRARVLATVEQGGCISDGCRVAGISRTTVSRWRDRAPWFEDELQRRLAIAGGALERLAWDRAVHGAEEKVIRGGEVVQIRIKPSDAMLRLLLQGAAPHKYGRTAGPAQAAAAELRGLKAKLRAEIEPELRAEFEAEMEERGDAARTRIAAKIERLRERMLRDGYREGPEGQMVPPGWKLLPDPSGAPGGAAPWRDPAFEGWFGADEDEDGDEDGEPGA